MLTLRKTRCTPIGIDVGETAVRAAQLIQTGDRFSVFATAQVDRSPSAPEPLDQSLQKLLTASRFRGRKLVTVHPLGGSVMGTDADSGVVDHRGRVFDPSSGPTAVHRGLLVADGSIVPTSLGINPLLTIAALAERIAYLLERDGP